MPEGEVELVAALRRGDETAFRSVFELYHPALVRAARSYVRTQSVAEEVAQETWLAVIRGLEAFEGRSSLKTWLFRILFNQARSRGERESRTTPMSSLVSDDERGVAADRFESRSGRHPRHWRAAPTDWGALPSDVIEAAEAHSIIVEAISLLPNMQRNVIWLRDVEGFSSAEVCSVLDLSEGNQRVVLHRARSRVRAALEQHLDIVGAA